MHHHRGSGPPGAGETLRSWRRRSTVHIRLVLLGGVHLRMMLYELATHLTLLKGDWALGTGYHHWSTALCASEPIIGIIAVLRTGAALSVMYPVLIHWALCTRVHSQL